MHCCFMFSLSVKDVIILVQLTFFPLIPLSGHKHEQTPHTDPDVHVEKAQQKTEEKIQVEFYV